MSRRKNDEKDKGKHRASLSARAIMSGVGNETIVPFLEAATHQEPIYGQDEIIAYESLTRPIDIPIGALSSAFYKAGIVKEFDLIACAIALEKAQNRPITLNISVDSALNPEFWAEMRLYFYPFDPEDIIFEILEHDVDLEADIQHLEAMRKRGYRFALDDFSVGQSHQNRLQVFGDLVYFLKFDGALVRAGIMGEDNGVNPGDFTRILDQLRDQYPHIALIAEHVHDRQEADTLFSLGFTGVQGRDLKDEDFSYCTAASSTIDTPEA